jgi:NDP-mannose synthase
MKAVILTGGLGTRLRPLTFSIPKPLVPVGEKAILQLMLERLAAQGVQQAILCTGYFAELIRAFCGDGSRFGIECVFVHESRPLGTAGPINLIRHLLEEDEDFLVINGDIVTKLDFSLMVDTHRTSGRPLTVGYTEYVYTSPFGVLEIEGKRLAGIKEKPTISFPVSCGISVVSARAAMLVPEEQYFTMPDLMRSLIDRGEEVGVYFIKEYWHGVESLADLELAAERLAAEETQ